MNISGPILNQPTWMVEPGVGMIQMQRFSILERGTNIPPGLEYLTTLDRVFVKQDLELLEIFCGCETNNRYHIKSSSGQILFKVKEDTDDCTRNCCGKNRPFDMYVKHPVTEQPLIHLSRPMNCDSYCCGFQAMDVFSPPGILVGSIKETTSGCLPTFDVLNASGQVELKIEGPCINCSCCSDVEFQVLSRNGETQVGKISKKWSGLIKETFTDADNFAISFPVNLSIQMKATLIGACFLIDFMYFEDSS